MDNKFENLRDKIRSLGSLLVAFSGGLDSAFLLKVASEELKDKACAITATSPTYSKREFKEAKAFCNYHSIKHIIIESNEMDLPLFRQNPKDRCYYCKKDLFSQCLEKAQELNFKYVADGANVDDLSDHRPGTKAAKELKIVRPLMDAEFSKEDIRKYSKELGLSTWDKPSYACLASRFPYGEEITEGKLSILEVLEDFIRDVGFKQVRVRHHGSIARIEVAKEESMKLFEVEGLKERISDKAKEMGFTYVALDLDGYRTGSMNES